jgi:hypothetical protein
MLTRAQIILIKRAQREAGLDDADYRQALQLVSGFTSSTDPGLTDRHLDLFLAFAEAVHWFGVDAGTLQPSGGPNAIFQLRDYWKNKNPRSNTSRDRFNGQSLGSRVADLEAALAQLGFDASYCAAIRKKVIGGANDDRSLRIYCAALQRTLDAKRRGVGAMAMNTPER